MINYLRNIWNSKLLTSCLLCLSLVITNSALAEYKKPPNTENDAPDSRSTSISGIRGSSGGCNGTETTSLTAFAPYTHIGKTNSTHPTFVWFVPDRQSYPVELQLSKYNASNASGKGNTVFKVTLKSTSGIMSYSLPKNQLGLSPGQKYVWQVAILCNPNRPSTDLVFSTEIIVVDTPISLQKQLTTVNDSLAKAKLYGENGLWYAALAEVVQVQDNALAEKIAYELIEELTTIEKLNQEENINTNDINEQRNIILTRKEHQKRLERILEVNS